MRGKIQVSDDLRKRANHPPAKLLRQFHAGTLFAKEGESPAGEIASAISCRHPLLRKRANHPPAKMLRQFHAGTLFAKEGEVKAGFYPRP